MKGLFLAACILIAHYFAGYWLNQQDRNPRYVAHFIKMNAAKASSFWRGLLVLGGSRSDDIVAEAAVIQWAGLFWGTIEIVIFLVSLLHPFDSHSVVVEVIFFISIGLLLVLTLAEGIRYQYRKYIVYNADHEQNWLSDICEAMGIRISFKCKIVSISCTGRQQRPTCTILLTRSKKMVKNALLFNQNARAGDYAKAVHYADNSSKYHWVII